jgi:DNA polymerase-3 subunit epsilon
MTRGQESLAIEVQDLHVSEVAFEAALDLDLIVLTPSDEELAAHLQTLAEIEKASGGSCLWKHLEL